MFNCVYRLRDKTKT